MRKLAAQSLAGAVALTATLAWLFLAPTALGGSTTYVVTDGISMLPHFHGGDLALVRSEGSYRVGEIVAYRSKLLDTIVLHRIVAVKDGHYFFKGDNNNYVDVEHPTQSQLVGALWLHIPGLGARLAPLRSPLAIGALVAAAVLFLGGGAFHRRRRRRWTPRRGRRPAGCAARDGLAQRRPHGGRRVPPALRGARRGLVRAARHRARARQRPVPAGRHLLVLGAGHRGNRVPGRARDHRPAAVPAARRPCHGRLRLPLRRRGRTHRERDGVARRPGLLVGRLDADAADRAGEGRSRATGSSSAARCGSARCHRSCSSSRARPTCAGATR